MEEYLGIDVGGTNIEIGIVNKKGSLLKKEKHPTKNLRDTGNFINEFVKLIGLKLKGNPKIKKLELPFRE